MLKSEALTKTERRNPETEQSGEQRDSQDPKPTARQGEPVTGHKNWYHEVTPRQVIAGKFTDISQNHLPRVAAATTSYLTLKKSYEQPYPKTTQMLI